MALATQRAMQDLGNAEFTLTAAAGMSGPYAIARFGDDLFGGAPRDGATLIVPTIVNAAQHAGAAIYRSPADIYEAQYAATIADLVPGTLGSSELVSQGKLPASSLFAADSMPQAPGSSQYFGANNLIRSDYLNDPFRSAKASFVAARTILRTANGDESVASSYHAGLVAPFCTAATRDYFQSIPAR